MSDTTETSGLPDRHAAESSTPVAPLATPQEVIARALHGWEGRGSSESLPGWAMERAQRVVDALGLRQFGKGWWMNRMTGELQPEDDEGDNRIYVLDYQAGDES